ncbi:MAG TPA: SLBB domain-containing protein [Terracidiphilus sp.]|jgi:protein involved in polysaccharide export with SLBB domain
MVFFKCLKGAGVNRRGLVPDVPALRLWPGSQISLLLLLCAWSTTSLAQGQSQSTILGASQSPSAIDCTDPLLASAAQCTGQAPLNPGFSSTPPISPTPDTGDQTANPTDNSSTVDQFGRPVTNQRTQTQQRPLPPEPLTEFQQFVASTTGQVLPIFGADLFRRVPSTFAPLDLTPVPSDYIIGPNDQLRIHVWGQVNFQTTIRVDRGGEIFLPQVGSVHVAGMPFSALDAHLRGAIGRIYHNFDLTVDVGQIRAVQVYMAGQARRPGVYTVSSLSTLADALFASGGPTVQGSLRDIQVRRNGAIITDFDLYDLLIHGDKTKDVKLQSEDVIYIPAVGPQVAVTGSVRSPGIYEMRQGETLARLLDSAGGATSVASGARVSIERIEEHRDRHAMEVAYDATGLATPLADGDLVRVYSIEPAYSKTVILRGNIANPGRFAWHAGMHVSDLIPDKESLITRNYWWKRAQLGLPAPEFEPSYGMDNLMQPADGHAVSLDRSMQDARSAANRSNNQQGQSTGMPGQSAGPNTGPQSQPQSQSQPGDQTDQSGNPSDQSGGTQNAFPDQHAASASIAAAQNSPNSLVRPNQRTDVKALAPEIDWDYAVIERINRETLKTVLIPFELGKLVMQHDGSQDLALEAGDVVSIFSGADIRLPLAHQTKFVRLDGEIAHAGIYTVEPGETLRQLVERAGGVTPDAYLYGSEFTRESTRIIQQARIDEYVQSLAMRIQRTELASGAANQANQPDLISTLRRIRATGRVVLRFTPDSKSTKTIPDIALEDGDRFVIPPVPATVNIVGAVYDQNSFLYTRNRKVGAYLRMAGGANRDADRKREFVVRADGEVESRAQISGSVWSGSGSEFNKLRIDPGDSIVVPDKTFKPNNLTNIINAAQGIGNLAIDAVLLTEVQ